MTRPKAHLTITRGDEVGRRYVIRAGQRFIIGRAGDCSISLSDQLISRHHAALELSHKGLFITDLSSRNGTKLDGKPLEPNSPEITCPADVERHVMLTGKDVLDTDIIVKLMTTRGELLKKFSKTKKHESN